MNDPATAEALDPAHAFTGAAGGDVLCWDIYSQVAQALRNDPDRLIGAPKVARVVAAGESQSAFRLSRYFNSIQPLHGLYDGFLLYDRGGPQPMRRDVAAKLISMGSEFFAEYGGSPPEDTENQRWWELAGASHVSVAEMQAYVDPQVLRDGTQRIDGRPVSLTELLEHGQPGARGPLWSHVPNGDLMKAALLALTAWVAVGTAPPTAPRLQLDEQGRLVRDAGGRTLGGIRYAAYDAPMATNVGAVDVGPRLAGYHLDFTRDEMTRRYGSLAAYVALVTASVQRNLAQGFLLPAEAARVIAEAGTVGFNR